MSYEIGASTNDCYPGTTCLFNKFDIRDESKFQEMEAAITFAKAGLLTEKSISEAFDFEHYKAIHRFSLEDISRKLSGGKDIIIRRNRQRSAMASA